MGPVDAAFRAVQRMVEHKLKVEIAEYHVDAITGGSDATVRVSVTVEDETGRRSSADAANVDIVIANEEIIAMVSRVNANMNLAPGSMGAAIATNLVRSGEIIRLSREVIRPFYEKKAGEAVEQLREGLEGIDFHIHKPEGAFFLWLWLRGLPITDHELYERLKKRGVLIVPGHYFSWALRPNGSTNTNVYASITHRMKKQSLQA